MSLERFIAATLVAQDTPTGFRRLREGWILEDEKPLYDFIKGHVARHGRLPAPDTLRQAGFRLPADVNEPASFYAERIRIRHAYNAVNSLQANYTSAMRQRDMQAVAQILRSMLTGMGGAMTADTCSSIATAAGMVLEDYEDAKRNPGLRGVTLAWPSLNAMTLGAQNGDLVVIAGRPGDGKTMMLLEMAYHQWMTGLSVLIVSMEMGALQLCRRWIGRHSRLNPNFIRAGELSDWGEEALRAAVRETQEGAERIYLLDGEFEKDVDGVEAMVREYDPDVVMVDGTYLLTESGRSRGYVSKWETVSNVVNSIKKRICLGLNKPVIVTFQFNRNLGNHPSRTVRQEGGGDSSAAQEDKGPDLRDIGGTDAAPQDASIVIGTRRGRPPHAVDRRRLYVMKNREGETGSFEINYKFSPVNFDEVTPESAEDHFGSDWML